jgi:GT2 family glycosyltransferase
MNTTVIIPVWNGASVIRDCLSALHANSGDQLNQVICVDNGSTDASADLIASHFSQVHLIRQPVNLGFAGGVNAGLRQVDGDLAVLLNQDCLVQPGWLDQIIAGLTARPSWGIAGCTLLNSDGSIDHAGAYLRQPSLRGEHRSQPASPDPHEVPYVTGALFAIHRSVWEEIGLLDEGFYPAYYEETDYCYRARAAGYGIGYVPAAQAIHLRSSRAWLRDPLHHATDQERSRYRFAVKHLAEGEFLAFADYEQAEIRQTPHFDAVLARGIAARQTLRALPDILAQGLIPVDADGRRHRLLQGAFRRLMHQAIWAAQRLSLSDLLDQSKDWAVFYPDNGRSPQEWLSHLAPALSASPESVPDGPEWQRAEALRTEEIGLMEALRESAENFETAEIAEIKQPWIARILQRIRRVVPKRESVLRSRLDEVRAARMDALHTLHTLQWQERWALQAEHAKVLHQFHRRLQLIELITDYDEP